MMSSHENKAPGRFFDLAIIKAGYSAARWIMWLCVVSLMLMMLVTAIDVIGRYFFNSPIPGALEFTELLLVVLVASGLAYTQTSGGHIEVDLLVARFPSWLRKYVLAGDMLICMILYALISWQAVDGGLSQMRSTVESGAFGLPLWPFYFFLSLGCAITCLVFLADLLKILRKGRGMI